MDEAEVLPMYSKQRFKGSEGTTAFRLVERDSVEM